MTFEKAYGQWLVSVINNRVYALIGKTCKQYDEVSFKPLQNNPDEIAVIINGGNATRSSVRGLDQNSLSVIVTVLCKNTYTDFVLQAIDSAQEAFNAIPMQLHYVSDISSQTVAQKVKTVFSTPFVLDERDTPSKNATIKAASISFSASVDYGQTAVVSPSEFTLIIDGTSYEISHIAKYDNASVPSYDSFLAAGDSHAMQTLMSQANSWSITVIKTDEDPLQAIFGDEINARDGLAGKTLSLVRDGGPTIPIRTYQLTESYIDNAAAYTLILGY